ncbi:apolipoprotein N-acyltransferase [Acuticoccus sp. MNP-M23]|uniref:apolipoprotein N-acyltransferase n=1 Tax=Acuticoccus sp. MNP-M23 TaxID=3072793 RepID=UPI0028157DF8|nr:apolipoprotein N-acyltransferase [Acuticoccus sp. MNP-M23]WMS43378.1 apolipoprotein N-acyltransferase [Acuticoccus sp. MNP-M23]
MAAKPVAPRTTNKTRLERLAERLAGRRVVRLGLAAFSGVGLALAFAPYDLLPALAAYSALLVLLEAGDARVRRRSLERFLTGFAFGFGFHLMGLWWIGAAFLVDADAYAWLMPLAVVGLPLLLAPFSGIAAMCVGLAPRGMAWRAVALALGVAGTELARGLVLTGFPWNAAGMGLTQSILLAQSASAVGVNGLAIPAVLIGALPVVLAERESRWLAVPTGLMLAAMATYGGYRLWTAPEIAADAPLIRIVQPAVPQDEKWAPEHQAEIWQRLLELTAEPGPAPAAGEEALPRPSVVIWPETAIPFQWRAPSAPQAALAGALGPETQLITGAVELAATADGRTVGYNALFVMSPEGRLVGRYDKAHLVPFGEYLPFSALMARLGLSGLAANGGEFVAGDGPVTLQVAGLPPFQPLICYEVIFPHGAGEPPARWIVNLTNDSWFGNTPGPRQHLRHAQLRAIERGLPVVRAANTGISAVIDAQGRIAGSLRLKAIGTLTERLPPPQPSHYSGLSDLLLFVILFLGGVSLGVVRVITVARRRPQDADGT